MVKGESAITLEPGMGSPDQQDDSAYRVAGSASEPHDCEHVAAKQEVGHGAEQGSVPEGAVDAG
ncbi:MAG: hypothetical protein O9343_17280, partial [Burkholderiaceae bacterium]|nr:hypothetical protein [Burkholderiaceae bacterium]